MLELFVVLALAVCVVPVLWAVTLPFREVVPDVDDESRWPADPAERIGAQLRRGRLETTAEAQVLRLTQAEVRRMQRERKDAQRRAAHDYEWTRAEADASYRDL